MRIRTGFYSNVGNEQQTIMGTTKRVCYLYSTQRPLTVIPFPPERLEQAQELRERLNKMQKAEFWHVVE